MKKYFTFQLLLLGLAISISGVIIMDSISAAETNPIETTGLVKSGDKSLTLIGPQLKVGDKLPEAVLVDTTMQQHQVSSFFGKVLIVCTVPSLDTHTCDVETRHFNQEAANLNSDILILTISNDLPFAQKRYCAAAGIDRVKVLSDFRGQQFGRAAGLFVKESYLLTRAVLVADKQGIIRYIQIVPVTGKEPDYEPALKAAQALL
jgi:thioredoxin-dependent peroxiredoxin